MSKLDSTQAVGIVEGSLTLVNIPEAERLEFKDDRIICTETGAEMMVDSEDIVSFSPVALGRQLPSGPVPLELTQQNAAPVHCPELQWPTDFEEFTNHNELPEC